MAEGGLPEQLISLFRETGRDHHEAYVEVGGHDPDWPIWYAEYLHARLAKLLHARFTKSELVYLLVTVDKEHALQAPGAEWTSYYARFFLERYT